MGTGSPGGRLISPSAGGEPASSTPGAFDLLEREAELGELERLIAGAKGGAGSILLLEGPPGIGKTELLARAVELGSNAGLEVLQASGSELEQDFAFGIARQLFEQPIQELDAKTREQVLDGAAALSAHLVGAHSGLPARTGAPSDLFSLLHGLYWLCANLSASRPLLIAIDDAHWADTASLKFVHYLARRLEGLPILVVLALRSTHPEAPVPLVEAVRAESPVAALELRALSQPATHRLVEESFDQAPDRVFVRACHDVSGGNPFLLTELARSLAADGVAPGAPAAADVLDVRSGTISRHVLVRLSRLGDEAQALARAIAVIGPTAETHRAAAVAGISEEAALEAVDALDAARVLAPQRPLRFGHALLRNAVYDDLTAGRRAALHERAARVLADADQSPEAVAGHLLHSEPSGDEWVVDVLRDAGRSALARGSPEVAVTYLRRALSEGPREPAAILVELGGAAGRAGEPEARDLQRRALDEADNDEVRVRAVVELGMDLANAGHLEESATVVRRTLAEIDPQRRELVRALEMMSLLMAECSVFARRVGSDLVARADDVVTRRGAEAPRGVLAAVAFERAVVSGTAASAAATAELALADGTLFIEQPVDAAGAYYATAALAMAGRMGDAERYLGDAIAQSRSRGSVRGIAFASAMRAIVRHQLGELRAAEEDARTFFELEADTDWSVFRLAAASALANTLLDTGDLPGAREAIADLGRDVDHVLVMSVRLSRARLMLASRESGGVAAELEHCRRWERAWGVRHPVWCEWRPLAALAANLEGDPATARRLAAEQVDLVRDFGSPVALGRALRVAGVVRGGEEGIELLRESVAALEGSEARLDHARALADLGSALRRAKHRVDSREPLRQAIDLALRCGAIPTAEAAQEELRATGARPRRLVLSGVESLTARERQVARLASQGLTNREIAQELFVSKKTVETHLGSVYRKLDVSSRESLAGLLARDD